MTTILTNEEKISIINQHIRNLEFALYNADLDLLQANAVSASEEILADIESRRSQVNTKIAALELEKQSLL